MGITEFKSATATPGMYQKGGVAVEKLLGVGVLHPLPGKIMKAKFHGKCSLCGVFFPEAAVISWKKGVGATHLFCSMHARVKELRGLKQVPAVQSRILHFLILQKRAQAQHTAMVRWYMEGDHEPGECLPDESSKMAKSHKWNCACSSAPWNQDLTLQVEMR